MFAIPIEYLISYGYSLYYSEIAIKLLDIVSSFIESISIKDSSELCAKDRSSFVDVTVDLEDMEVSGCDYELSLPVFEDRVIYLFTYCDCFKVCQVRHMQVLTNQ